MDLFDRAKHLFIAARWLRADNASSQDRDMAVQYRQMARQRDEYGLRGRAVDRRNDAA